MLLFYINRMYISVKNSYEASFRVEIVFGQNIRTCIWPKCPCPKSSGQNVCGQNVRPPPLPDDKIFDWSKLKQVTENILKCILNVKISAI